MSLWVAVCARSADCEAVYPLMYALVCASLLDDRSLWPSVHLPLPQQAPKAKCTWVLVWTVPCA